ncbi:MAG TPA: hypothetical protein VMF87_13730 [Streptosporangiaceae bacterium]|nr:hypothetical protein [Streptosporangiaceae bacterium]
MGFAWEPANVTGSGMPEPWDWPPPSPRHRRPSDWQLPRAGTFARVAATAIAGASRRARTLICTRPALVDHRRAF